MNQTVQMAAFSTPTEILNRGINDSDNEVINEMPIDITAEMLSNEVQPANNVVPNDYQIIQDEDGKQMQHVNSDDDGREAHTSSFVGRDYHGREAHTSSSLGSDGHERESYSSSSVDHLEPSIKTRLFENTTGKGNITVYKELSDTFDPYSELYKTDNSLDEYLTQIESKYLINETLGKIFESAV